MRAGLKSKPSGLGSDTLATLFGNNLFFLFFFFFFYRAMKGLNDKKVV